MYLLYGEQTANGIAWIHEQYASDGWSDTLQDFYNNKKGIEIGKKVEKLLGPERMKRLRGEGDNNIMFEINTADAWRKAWTSVEELVVKYAKTNGLAILPLKTFPNITTYNPGPYIRFVLPDAQRFWDSQVFYNPNPSDMKPPARPK
jgi:hypothetical protein